MNNDLTPHNDRHNDAFTSMPDDLSRSRNGSSRSPLPEEAPDAASGFSTDATPDLDAAPGRGSAAAIPAAEPATRASDDSEERPYVSSLPPEETYRVVNLKLPTPEVDAKFIMAKVLSGAPDGKACVRDFHIGLFGAAHEAKLENLRQQEATRAANVAGRQRECNDLDRELNAKTERFYNKTAAEGAEPWGWQERLEFALFAVLPIVSISVAIFNPANIMRHSGLPGFESWLNAIPFCVTVLLGAVALKGLARVIPARFQRIFAGSVLTAGIVCFLVWVLPFSELIGSLLTPASERLEAVANADAAISASAPSSHLGWSAILLATLAETLICAGSWMICGVISRAHKLQSSNETPAWKTKRAALDKATKRKTVEENLLGIVRGELRRELRVRDVLAEKACAIFEAADAHQKNMRRLLG